MFYKGVLIIATKIAFIWKAGVCVCTCGVGGLVCVSSKLMLTNNNDYTCCIKAAELGDNGSIYIIY